jgi:hypothetical protein
METIARFTFFQYLKTYVCFFFVDSAIEESTDNSGNTRLARWSSMRLLWILTIRSRISSGLSKTIGELEEQRPANNFSLFFYSVSYFGRKTNKIRVGKYLRHYVHKSLY